MESYRMNGIGTEPELHSQNGNPSKINPERKWHVSSPKTTVNAPAFHQQQPTTNSPAKNHIHS
jgi:hypothetical protein